MKFRDEQALSDFHKLQLHVAHPPSDRCFFKIHLFFVCIASLSKCADIHDTCCCKKRFHTLQLKIFNQNFLLLEMFSALMTLYKSMRVVISQYCFLLLLCIERYHSNIILHFSKKFVYMSVSKPKKSYYKCFIVITLENAWSITILPAEILLSFY